MKLRVRLFARARDVAGAECVEIELPDQPSVADLRTALGQQYPDMKPLIPNLLIAVGRDYADDNATLLDESEVACFPPVSGG